MRCFTVIYLIYILYIFNMKNIKSFESFETKEIFSKQFPEFLFIVGNKSEDMFTFFGVDEMHGVNRFDAQKKVDTKNSAYIAGFCNEFPNDPSKFFLFINSLRFNGTYEDYLTVMHECMHLSFLVNGINVAENEEEIITWGENQSMALIKVLKDQGYVK